jgi:8-oxo-dGTP pyrophosphatase MutT (NUDIX family)
VHRVTGDGDGWVRCAQGHRHWGLFGAAGVLITDVESGRARRVLQHRAPWTHSGDTWGVPGGARDSHEDVVTAALREAREEAGVRPNQVRPLGTWADDHGGWSYTTVLARSSEPFIPRAANAESLDVRWVADDEVESLPLHPGLAAAWPRLRLPIAPLSVVIDAANVVGSTPDGWWRDRLGATDRLLSRLAPLARDGLAVATLPDGINSADLHRLFPTLVVVVEGAARPTESRSRESGGDWSAGQLRVVRAERDGDSEVVATASRLRAAQDQVLIVTADRELRSHLAPVPTVGPRWLLDQLPT